MPIAQEDCDYRINGHRLRVRWLYSEGPQARVNPVLVFLHEALGSTDMWKEFPEALCRTCRCHGLIYDRLGHGASDPLPAELAGTDYLFPESWHYLPKVLDQAGISRAVLVGHSDGGSIALLAAARHPGRIAGVVAEAAHVLIEEITKQGIRKTVYAPEVEQLKERVARYHQQPIEPIFTRWPQVWLSEAYADWTIERFLPDIHCPVLVIQGEDDQYGSLRQMETICSGCSGPCESLVIPDCGHVPHFQTGEKLLAKIPEFLRLQGLIAEVGD